MGVLHQRPRRVLLGGAAAGAVFGLVATLSPMVVWFALAMGLLFWWAGRDLGPRERRWVLGLLGVAVAARLVALLAFFLATRVTDGSFAVLVPDEAYLAYRAHMQRLIAIGVPLSLDEYRELSAGYGESGVHYVHAYLQLLLGHAPYTVRLFDITLHLAACVPLYRMCRSAFGRVAAAGGLAVVLFLPSLFVWSLAYLKEAPVLLLTALGVVGAVTAVQARTSTIRARALGVLLVIVAAAVARTIRPGGDLIIGGGAMAGAIAGMLFARPLVLGALLVAGLAAVAVGLTQPPVQERLRAAVLLTATSHKGYVNTEGQNYRLLDDHLYRRADTGHQIPPAPAELTAPVVARYVIRAVSAFFIYPLPWQASSANLRAFLPEQLVWNVLVLLAFVGCVSGLRRDPVLTLSLAGVILGTAVVVGMASGNFGTLIRHRSMVALLLPWLSGVGASALIARASSHRASSSLPDSEANTHALH